MGNGQRSAQRSVLPAPLRLIFLAFHSYPAQRLWGMATGMLNDPPVLHCYDLTYWPAGTNRKVSAPHIPLISCTKTLGDGQQHALRPRFSAHLRHISTVTGARKSIRSSHYSDRLHKGQGKRRTACSIIFPFCTHYLTMAI